MKGETKVFAYAALAARTWVEGGEQCEATGPVLGGFKRQKGVSGGAGVGWARLGRVGHAVDEPLEVEGRATAHHGHLTGHHRGRK